MDFAYKLPVEFELYKKAGDAIKEAMQTNSLTVGSLARRLKEDGIFQSYGTAKRFVIDVRNGYFNFIIGNKPDLRKTSLERIAYLFSSVGVAPDNEIIGIFRGLNSDFIYPNV